MRALASLGTSVNPPGRRNKLYNSMIKWISIDNFLDLFIWLRNFYLVVRPYPRSFTLLELRSPWKRHPHFPALPLSSLQADHSFPKTFRFYGNFFLNLARTDTITGICNMLSRRVSSRNGCDFIWSFIWSFIWISYSVRFVVT